MMVVGGRARIRPGIYFVSSLRNDRPNGDTASHAGPPEAALILPQQARHGVGIPSLGGEQVGGFAEEPCGRICLRSNVENEVPAFVRAAFAQPCGCEALRIERVLRIGKPRRFHDFMRDSGISLRKNRLADSARQDFPGSGVVAQLMQHFRPDSKVA